MKALVSGSASGAFESGVGSSSQVIFSAEEIAQAKGVLKAALKKDVKNALHQGHLPQLRKLMEILVASQAIPDIPGADLQNFYKDFDGFSITHATVTQDLFLIEE